MLQVKKMSMAFPTGVSQGCSIKGRAKVKYVKYDEALLLAAPAVVS
jgi:hypothetical protein